MIKLIRFNLEKIDKIKHYHLIKTLSDDKGMYDYVSKNFATWIDKQQSDSDEKIELEKSYVIEKDNKYIGIIGTLNLEENGTVEVWCGIDKNYRSHGYGDKILSEFSTHLIGEVDGVNNIKLKINKYNIVSWKVAEKNGYIKEKEVDGIYEYYYFPKKR